jgi:hypothetical protein
MLRSRGAPRLVYNPMYAEIQGALTFSGELRSSLTPSYAAGSATPTFARADGADGRATFTDFEGRVVPVRAGEARFQGARRVRNLVTNSASTATWNAHQPTETAGIDDPYGGTSAIRLTSSGGGPYAYLQLSTIPAGRSVRVSFWARKQTVAGGDTVIFYNGSGTTNVDITALLTTSWRRIALPVASASGTNDTFGVGLGQTVGNSVDFYGFMWEDVTGQTNQNPSEYVSVGVLSAPYHGAAVDGVKYFTTLNGNSVASNVVTEATGAAINSGQAACAGGVTAGVVDAFGPLGYLSEGSRVQYLGVTDTPATQTTASLGTGSYTLWVVGTGNAAVAGATATITGAGTATAGTPVTFTVTVAGTVTVTVTGSLTRFQLENGAFASSYIPNAGAAGTTVTRAADSLTYVSAGNILTTVGAFACEMSPTSPFGAAVERYLLADSVANRQFANFAAATTLQMYDGTNINQWTVTTPTVGAVTKIATQWGGSTMSAYQGGAQVSPATKAFDGSFDALTAMQLGGAGNACLFGTIRNVRIFNRALTASQVAAL